MCCATHTHTLSLMSYTQSGNQSCCQCESRRLSQISSSATLLTLNYGFDFTAQHEAFPLKLTLMLSDEINTTITLAINANQPLCLISSQHEIKVGPFYSSLCFCSWLICGHYAKKMPCSTSETTSFWLISEIPLMFPTPSLKSPGFFLSCNFHFSRSNKFPNHHYTKKCNHDVRYKVIREELFF